MTSSALVTSLLAGMIGFGLGGALMAWHGYWAEKAALDAWADAKKRWRESADRYEAAVTDLDTVITERDELLDLIESMHAALGLRVRAP